MPEPPNAICAVSTARFRSDENTMLIPSLRRRLPSLAACTSPSGESLPPSQPVAIPRSLSSLVECVSNTRSTLSTRPALHDRSGVIPEHWPRRFTLTLGGKTLAVNEAARVALVAGATRGAGRAIAVELARSGFYVYATGRSSRTAGASEIGRPETIEETGDVIAATGGDGSALVVDHE